MNNLEQIFNEFDKIINSSTDNIQTGIPECPTNEVLTSESINTQKEQKPLFKSNSDGLRQYKIIPETRSLVIDGEVYQIEPYFSVKNAMAGNYKALDYIFHHKGFNIDDFEIRKETDMN